MNQGKASRLRKLSGQRLSWPAIPRPQRILVQSCQSVIQPCLHLWGEEDSMWPLGLCLKTPGSHTPCSPDSLVLVVGREGGVSCLFLRCLPACP